MKFPAQESGFRIAASLVATTLNLTNAHKPDPFANLEAWAAAERLTAPKSSTGYLLHAIKIVSGGCFSIQDFAQRSEILQSGFHLVETSGCRRFRN